MSVGGLFIDGLFVVGSRSAFSCRRHRAQPEAPSEFAQHPKIYHLQVRIRYPSRLGDDGSAERGPMVTVRRGLFARGSSNDWTSAASWMRRTLHHPMIRPCSNA